MHSAWYREASVRTLTVKCAATVLLYKERAGEGK